MIGRREHINLTKKAAMAVVQEAGHPLYRALQTLVKGLCDHPATAAHPDILLATILWRSGDLKSHKNMLEFIESVE